MLKDCKSFFIICFFLFNFSLVLSQEMYILDKFNNLGKTVQDQEWFFITDGVMGGLSKGILKNDIISKKPCYRMQGNVTTENNGGFIMTRTILEPNIKAKDYKGIYLKVYGTGDNYYIHLRTPLTLVPWQYYSYKFKTTNQWQEIKAPFSDFQRSNFYQPKSISNQTLKTIGLVAGFDDYQADICFTEIGFY